MRKYLVITILVQLIAVVTFAQTKEATADFEKLASSLNKHRYTYKLTYSLFDTYKSTKPVETQTMDVKMWDMMINIKNEHFQVIKNAQYYLYINPDEKFMMVNTVRNYSEEMNELSEIQKMLDIDTLLSMYKRVEPIPLNAGRRGYRLFMKDNLEYAFIDIITDSQSGTLDAIILYYAKELDDLLGHTGQPKTNKLPRLEMRFTNFVVTPTFNEAYFSVTPFFTGEGKKLVPSESYKEYKFINNTF